jgi:hypothetical protein
MMRLCRGAAREKGLGQNKSVDISGTQAASEHKRGCQARADSARTTTVGLMRPRPKR